MSSIHSTLRILWYKSYTNGLIFTLFYSVFSILWVYEYKIKNPTHLMLTFATNKSQTSGVIIKKKGHAEWKYNDWLKLMSETESVNSYHIRQLK